MKQRVARHITPFSKHIRQMDDNFLCFFDVG